MTFGAYAKKQLWYEPNIGTNDFVGNYMPSISGTLKHVRIRYIITENWAQDFNVSLRVVDSFDNSLVVDTSNSLTLDNFTLPNSPLQFHQGWIRFDFAGNKNLSANRTYRLEIVFNAASYTTDSANFVMFAIDYPFRTYETSGDDDPSMNGYGDIQLYLERRYDDFIER